MYTNCLTNKTAKGAQYYLDKLVKYIVNGVTEDWSRRDGDEIILEYQ